MRNLDDIVKEITSRKDPNGFYVLIAKYTDETMKILEEIGSNELSTDFIGEVVLVKTKSRRLAQVIARRLLIKGHLVLDRQEL